MLSMRWYSSPRRIEAKGYKTVGDGIRQPYFSIDGVEITFCPSVGDDDLPHLEMRKESHSSTKADRTLPSIEVDGGEIRFSFEDLVPLILERIAPEDLAVAICSDPEARQCIVDNLSERYSEKNLGDVDRRRFLARVQEAVHSAAVDKLSGRLQDIEYAATRLANTYVERSDFNAFLRGHGCVDRNGVQLEYRMPPTIIDTRIMIGSEGTWAEARAYWRDTVAKWFAPPVIPTESEPDPLG